MRFICRISQCRHVPVAAFSASYFTGRPSETEYKLENSVRSTSRSLSNLFCDMIVPLLQSICRAVRAEEVTSGENLPSADCVSVL